MASNAIGPRQQSLSPVIKEELETFEHSPVPLWSALIVLLVAVVRADGWTVGRRGGAVAWRGGAVSGAFGTGGRVRWGSGRVFGGSRRVGWRSRTVFGTGWGVGR